ncbi:MAG: hypothetical protein RBU21_15860, partial [FCB group bacterium]|nr:hypothetical protein [FCB group bacterium]
EREACCDALAASATGFPVAYATALADLAGRLNIGAAQPVLAATGNDDKHVLLDRVKRLLVPGYRPRLGLPWYTLTALLIAGMAVLAALSQGVFSAVVFAAQVLTPVERIQKIEAIEQAHAPLPRDENGESKVKIPVSGTVRTEDGAPLPENLRLTLISMSDNETASVGCCVTDGRFEQKMTPGILYATVSGDGYAFSVAGPLLTTPDKPAENLDVVLQHGTPVQIRVTSTDGAPLADAALSGYYNLGSAGTGHFDLKTDQDGLATFAYCEDFPVSLLVIAQGLARERYTDVKLDPGRPFECRLQPTPAATGVVRAAESGQPLAGVVLRLAGERGPLGDWGGELKGEVLATTDAQGVYAITTLRDDTEYGLVAYGPDGRRMVAGTVSAGKTLDLNLPAPIRIRGRIIGDLTHLAKDDQEPYVEYSQTIELMWSNFYNESDHATVEIRGGEGFFETEPLWPGELYIGPDSHQQRLEVSHSIDDFVLDLSASKQPEESLRTVVLRFEADPGLPVPEGVVRIHATRPDWPNALYPDGRYMQVVTLANGEARAEIPVPCKLGYNLEGLIGYWAEDKWGIDLPAGTEPFVLNIPVRPAGAVHGIILNPDGTAATSLVSFIRIKEPDELQGKGYFDAKPVKDGNFLIAPIPFGYTCAVLAWSGARMVLSDELQINETSPIHELTMQFVPGLPIRGRLLDESGNPVTDLNAGLSYVSPYSGSYGGSATGRPDSDGRFVIEGVNPDLRGRYSLSSQSKLKYVPFLVDATPGGPEQTIVVKRGLSLHGTVLDQAGVPVKATQVKAMAHETTNLIRAFDAEQPTGDDGAFRFSNLAPGKYHFYVNGLPLLTDTPVPAGTAEPVLLRMRKK